MTTIRGIFEREKGSGVWWIRWTDSDGNKRREKAGRRSDAITLLAKRKTEKLRQAKLPETIDNAILFSELLDDALEHSQATNGARSTRELKMKINRLRPDWDDRKAAEITKQEIVRWLQAETVNRDWTVATSNRWQACFSLIFRVALDNQKIAVNPASRIRRKAENNQSVRFLTPEEEKRIRKVLSTRCPSCLPAFIVSLHTGLRASEQWNLRWSDIDLERRLLTVRRQKTGKGERHIPLNQRCPFSELKRNSDEYPPRLVRSGGGRSEGLRLHLAQESAHLRFPAGDGRGRHPHHRAAHGPRYTTDVHEVRPLESGSQSSSGRSAGYFRRQTDTKADTRKTLKVKSFRIICESGEIGRRTRLRIWRGNPWGFESPLSHQSIPG
jgi:integrase